MRIKNLVALFTAILSTAIVGCKDGDGNKEVLQTLESEQTVQMEEISVVEKPSYGGSLRTVILNEPLNLMPYMTSDSTSSALMPNIYSTLVERDDDHVSIGTLALGHVVDPENASIYIEIDVSAKWHDGVNVSSQDILYSYEFADKLQPEIVRDIASAEIIDDSTIRFIYHNRYEMRPESLNFWILPSHLLKGKTIQKSHLQRYPVGTGPFVFNRWDAGLEISLKANDDYFDGRPYIDQLSYDIVYSEKDILLSIAKDKIDFVEISPSLAGEIISQHSPNFDLHRKDGSAHTFIAYNTETSIFKNNDLRRVVNDTLNRQSIVDKALHGMGSYNEDIHEAFDILGGNGDFEKALPREDKLAILNTNGYEKDSNPFVFFLGVNSENEELLAVAEAIKEDMKEIGAIVKIEIIDWYLLMNHIRANDYDAVLFKLNSLSSNNFFHIWHSENCHEVNLVCYKNGTVDRLIEGIESGNDASDNLQLLAEITRREGPYTYLHSPDIVYVTNRSIGGVTFEDGSFNSNILDWYVRDDVENYEKSSQQYKTDDEQDLH